MPTGEKERTVCAEDSLRSVKKHLCLVGSTRARWAIPRHRRRCGRCDHGGAQTLPVGDDRPMSQTSWDNVSLLGQRAQALASYWIHSKQIQTHNTVHRNTVS